MEENTLLNKSKNIASKADGLAGDALAMASNKAVPIAGPILVQLLWKNKITITLIILSVVFVMCFSFESLSLQALAGTRGLIEQIPASHKECIEKAKDKYQIEFELLASYGKVIADFDEKHTGNGKGFLEISETDWEKSSIDGDEDGKVETTSICDNYFTLANILSQIEGVSENKIESYPYEKKEVVKEWYLIYKGLIMIPYGNPVGLTRSDLVTVSSGYNVVRIINGKENVHRGIDLVPSGKWYEENPGKSSKDAVINSIISGDLSNTIDGYGALCSTVTNELFKVINCHCDAFIGVDGSKVAYGSPLCFMGTTGLSTGVHVHVEIFQKDEKGKWQRIDPTPLVFPVNNYAGQNQ